jgi:hypothetical protein
LFSSPDTFPNGIKAVPTPLCLACFTCHVSWRCPWAVDHQQRLLPFFSSRVSHSLPLHGYAVIYLAASYWWIGWSLLLHKMLERIIFYVSPLTEASKGVGNSCTEKGRCCRDLEGHSLVAFCRGCKLWKTFNSKSMSLLCCLL